MLPRLLLAAAVAALVHRARPQTTNVVCLPTFDWATNSLGQNPCKVLAYLEAECNGGVWEVDAIPADRHYSGPQGDQVNRCQCSSVVYSLVTACGLCQNRTVIGWSEWSTNCSQALTTVAQWPLTIPPATAIPAYAYQDVRAKDMFDPAAAKALAASHPPDSSAPPAATSTHAASAEATSAPPPVVAGGPATNVPAIVGGAVGGAVGLALLVVLAVVLFRRMPRRPRPLSRYLPGATRRSSYDLDGVPLHDSFLSMAGSAHKPKLAGFSPTSPYSQTPSLSYAYGSSPAASVTSFAEPVMQPQLWAPQPHYPRGAAEVY